MAFASSSPPSPDVTLAPIEALPPRDEPATAGALPISLYWSLVQRHGSRILTFICVVTAVVVLIALAIPKKYQSTVLLRVDPSSSRVVGEASRENSAQVEANMLVATEGEVITSPAVITQTVQALKLGALPEFRTSEASDRTGAGVSGELLRLVTKRITVDQPVGTLLLRIGFTSRDRQLAATAANELAQAFLEHEYVTRAKALTDSTRYMSFQVDSLRAQMEKDQSTLVTYESSHDVLDPDNKENIYRSRLQQINADLTTAQSDRMRLEAEYKVTQSGNPDAILATRLGAELQPLEQRLLTDQSTLDHLASIYGPNHPLYRQQQAVVTSDDRQLREREGHIANQVRIQYLAAVEREGLITAALNNQKQALDAFNMRAIRYNALAAEAQSSTNLYNDLMQRIQDATVASGLRSEDLRVISPAQPSDRPVSPRPILYGFIAMLLSALLGVGAALAAGMADRTVTTAEQAEGLFRRPVLGLLPLLTKGQASLQASLFLQRGPATESVGQAYREAVLSLQSTLQLALASGGAVIAVTSSVPGEGKSTTTCQLASAFAVMGARVALVDADMRKPNVHRFFGLSNQQGLSSVLEGRCLLAQVSREITPQLTIVPAGPASPRSVELLRLGLSSVVEEMRGHCDYVFLDCPPLLGFADAILATNLADSTLLVVKAGVTDQRWVNAAIRELRGGRANLQGLVLNCMRARSGGEYGYYSYASRYYAEAAEEQAEEEA